MDFNSLKKNRKKSFEELTAKLEKEDNKNFKGDDRYWRLTRDKAGNGTAVIRFLPPAPDDGENYFVETIKNYTKGPSGKYYSEFSRRMLGPDEKDPFAERKSSLWNISEDDNSPSKIAARKMERRVSKHYNIYVVKDPGCPENEGKNFLFKGIKFIDDKLKDAMFPPKDEFEEKSPFNPYDFWEGANMVVRVRKDGEWASYDKSDFTRQAPLIDTGDEDADNAAMENIWRAEYKLSDLISVEKFKSYDDLKKKLYTVLELDNSGEEIREKAASSERKPHVAEKAPVTEDDVKESSNDSPDDDDEIDIAKFKAMMED